MPNKDEQAISTRKNPMSLSLFEKLPRELLDKHVAKLLSNRDLANLSQTSRTMFSSCRPLVEKRKLSCYIMNGNETKALEIIEENPKLLLSPVIKRVTPFQLALLLHDVALWKKMVPFFDRLPNGSAEKIRQFKQLFPTGLPRQEPYDFTELIQAISNSSESDLLNALQKQNNDTQLCLALTNFRASFAALAEQEIFFNPMHLIKASQIYDAPFRNWGLYERDLFWRQVIGYIQRFVPACYAQAFCQGIYYIVEENKPLSRSLAFLYHASSFFPLADTSGLGFDMAVTIGWPAQPVGRFEGTLWWNTNMLNKYVQQIFQSYADFLSTCEITQMPSTSATL